MDESLATRSMRWRKLFIVSAGFGAGVAVVMVVTAGLLVWYAARPAKLRPWNRDAIVAKYADLYMTTGQPLVLTFRYTLENQTNRDYELPGVDSLYRVLANGRGLEHDATLKWDGATFIPAGQKINLGIHVEYDYREGTSNLDEALNAYTKRRLSEIEGFAALDRVSRYEIRFPKPPEVK